MIRCVSAAIAVVMVVGQAAAQESIDAKEVRATTLDLAEKLESGYMDEGIGAAYAKMLREKVSANAYDQYTDANEFAAAVTEDIQAVNADAHISLRFSAPVAAPAPSGDGPQQQPFFNPIGETKWIEDGVAYSEWHGFFGGEDSVAHARKVMKDYAGAKAIIFDIRHHRGGGVEEMDVFFEYLFPNPTHLLTMNIREGKGGPMVGMLDSRTSMRRQETVDGVNSWQHWSEPGDDDLGWAETPVYVLTSARTASSSEHFSLAVKTTQRATLIGESTYGAGHFGGPNPIGERFTCFIPVGETIDPKTGKGWEGVGVKPDIETPADQALEKALSMIRGS